MHFDQMDRRADLIAVIPQIGFGKPGSREAIRSQADSPPLINPYGGHDADIKGGAEPGWLSC